MVFSFANPHVETQVHVTLSMFFRMERWRNSLKPGCFRFQVIRRA